MKAVAVLRKSLRETRRDRLVVALTLVFGPLFVIVYYLSFHAAAASYTVAVLNQDRGAVLTTGAFLDGGSGAVKAIGAARDSAGKQVVTVVRVRSEEEGLSRLRSGEANVLVMLDKDFSQTLAYARGHQTAQTGESGEPGESGGGSEPLVLQGDLTDQKYLVASVMADAAVDDYVQQVTGRADPLRTVERPLGESAVRSEFETYVPGLLVLAVIMLLFQASMAIARECEAGTIRRLRLSRMTSADYLLGTSAVLVTVGLGAVLLTFATASACGFGSSGPLWVAVLVTAVTAVSVIGVGMIVGGLAQTVSQAFVIANFPFGLLMFFSGAMFPLPDVNVATIAGHRIGPFDLLPPRHAVTALDKILTLGEGLGDVMFELGALVTLTALYFAVGTLVFKRHRLHNG